MKTLNITAAPNTAVALLIHDIGGHEYFQEFAPKFAAAANSCILVYDVTNESSFKSLSKWREIVLKSNKKFPAV